MSIRRHENPTASVTLSLAALLPVADGGVPRHRGRTIHLQAANTPCARVAAYRALVARDGAFAIWTLERVLAALDDVIDTKNLRARYG